MTSAQRLLARFSLGLPNAHSVGLPSDYYCHLGDEDEAAWLALAERGLAELRYFDFGIFTYRLTEAGARAALQPGEGLDPRSFANTAALT